MTYTPQTWENEVPATTPAKYTIIDDTAGVIAASASIELVTEVTPGTPLDAARMNHIEQGIADVDAALNDLNVLSARGDLIASTSAGKAGRLAAGAAGTILVPDAAETLGLKWVPQVNLGLWTHTDWDGDPKLASTTYPITLASFGLNVPGIKLVMVYLTAQWATVNNAWIAAHAAGNTDAAYLRVRSQVANLYNDASAWVPVENGGLTLQTSAQAPASVFLRLVGYML